ncbi:MAG: hypothetical protein MUE94_00330 [Verrucomicrobia bacterium]|nr:hypothetical protein [Verrucomicrobiota bacterium]
MDPPESRLVPAPMNWLRFSKVVPLTLKLTVPASTSTRPELRKITPLNKVVPVPALLRKVPALLNTGWLPAAQWIRPSFIASKRAPGWLLNVEDAM